MNWEAIGAVGEITGAILLLGSLIYLGVQIRDTKRQMSAAGAQARSDALRDLMKERMSEPYLEAHIKSLNNPTDLTEKERFVLGNWLYMFLSFMENSFYQRAVGMLDETQKGALDSMPLVTGSDLHIEMWENYKQAGLFSETFLQHVDRLIRERPIT
jgi:hypothetical protein